MGVRTMTSEAAALAIAGAAVALFVPKLWHHPVSSAAPAMQGEAPILAALTLPDQREPFALDEPVEVELRLENRGDAAVSVLVPDARERLDSQPRRMHLTLMNSSEALMMRGPVGRILRPAASGAAALALFPRAFWGCRVNLLELFGTLEPDAYRVRIEYEARADDPAVTAASRDHPAIWIGRVESSWVAFRVRSPDQPSVTASYSKRWLDSRVGSADLRALEWLAANALDPGLAEDVARGLLGQPEQIAQVGATIEWRYRIDRIGFTLRIENGKVAGGGFSES